MAKFLKNNLSIRSYRSLLCAYTVFNTFRLSLSLFNLYLLVFSSSMLSLVLFYLNCLPLISVLLIVNLFVKKWAKPGLFFFIFLLPTHCKDKYSTNLTVNDRSKDGVLGSRTRGSRMEGADESIEYDLILCQSSSFASSTGDQNC